MQKEVKKFEQVVQKIDPQGKLLRAWELKGGVSAQVTALEIERSGDQTQKMVIRRYGDVDLKHNSHIAADEYALLHLLHCVELATPTPYYFDQSGEIFPTPYIVIEYIEGASEFAPSYMPDFILQLTTQLSSIHMVESSELDLSFLPQQENIYAEMFRERPANVDESLDEGRIRAALQAAWPFPRRNAPVLLHGDFWPGNLLWKDEQLVAVIDWEDAQVGDPLADVANCRLEMLWAFGSNAMQHFTEQYQTITGIDLTNLPYWDLCAALRPASKLAGWGLDAATEKTMRERHGLFVTQAFEKLAFQSKQ